MAVLLSCLQRPFGSRARKKPAGAKDSAQAGWELDERVDLGHQNVAPNSHPMAFKLVHSPAFLLSSNM